MHARDPDVSDTSGAKSPNQLTSKTYKQVRNIICRTNHLVRVERQARQLHVGLHYVNYAASLIVPGDVQSVGRGEGLHKNHRQSSKIIQIIKNQLNTIKATTSFFQ